jgi:hypothetical protein
LTPPHGVAFRRNVPLLARVDGVLLEEQVDLVYLTTDGYILLLDGPDPSAERQLRAGRAALAFAAATGQRLHAVKIVQTDGATSTADLPLAIAHARAELRRLHDPAASADAAPLKTT